MFTSAPWSLAAGSEFKSNMTLTQKWLSELELSGTGIRLVPLKRSRGDSLVEAASDGQLWDLWYTSVPSPKTIDAYIKFALEQQSLDKALAFVVIDQNSNKVIGSTRFCNAEPEHKRLEIGYTWYAKRFQRTSVNTECKMLMLQNAFEVLNCIAIEFRTHWHNQASRTAIERLGAKQNGILRNHRKEASGAYRDTVVFSIQDREWPTVKQSLIHKLIHQD